MVDDDATGEERFIIRMPKGMRQRIARAAKEHHRSMNAELVSVLSNYYPPEPTSLELLHQIDLFLTWAKRPEADRIRAEGRHSLIPGLVDLAMRLLAEYEAEHPELKGKIKLSSLAHTNLTERERLVLQSVVDGDADEAAETPEQRADRERMESHPDFGRFGSPEQKPADTRPRRALKLDD